MKEHLIKRFIASIKCGSCGSAYREGGIEILERRDELWFFKVYCPSCHVCAYVAAIIREERKPEFITDLTGDELEKFRKLRAVNDEDLFSMHEFLKEFDGDFPRLFRGE